MLYVINFLRVLYFEKNVTVTGGDGHVVTNNILKLFLLLWRRNKHTLSEWQMVKQVLQITMYLKR